MKQQYQDINFRPHSLRMIDDINDIIDEYQAAGYTLTVRQLYYQLVARDIIENTMKSYKSAASLINDARIAGLIDWDAIEDRTRAFITRPRWSSGRDILNVCAQQFHMDMWHDQARRVFVVVEKEALVGVLEPVCRDLDVPLLAARGYPSASVVREFSNDVVIPSIGDGPGRAGAPPGRSRPQWHRHVARPDRAHRTVHGRLRGRRFRVAAHRIEHGPGRRTEATPNPAKTTDARFASYKKKFGSASWELDALPPEYIDALVRKHVNGEIDERKWKFREKEIATVRAKIKKIADSF